MHGANEELDSRQRHIVVVPVRATISRAKHTAVIAGDQPRRAGEDEDVLVEVDPIGDVVDSVLVAPSNLHTPNLPVYRAAALVGSTTSARSY